MSYLNGILKDEAACAIAGLPMTSDNYIKATVLLKERFGQKQVYIKRTHGITYKYLFTNE